MSVPSLYTGEPKGQGWTDSFRPVIWPHHRGSLGWWRAPWGPQKMAIRTSPKGTSRAGSPGPPRPGTGKLPEKTMPMCLHQLWTRSLPLLVQPCTFLPWAVPWVSPSHFFHRPTTPSTAPHLPSNLCRPRSLISKQLLLTVPGVLPASPRLPGALKRPHPPEQQDRKPQMVQEGASPWPWAPRSWATALTCSASVFFLERWEYDWGPSLWISAHNKRRKFLFSSSRMEKQRFLLQSCIFRWDYSEPARLAGKILQFSQIPLHR